MRYKRHFRTTSKRAYLWIRVILVPFFKMCLSKYPRERSEKGSAIALRINHWRVN